MLEGIIRESTGKKATKALRQDGYLIANIYGKGLQNVHAAFKRNDYIKALKSKTTLAFEAKVGNETYKLIVQDYQKDPVTYDLLHVDLLVAQPSVSTFYQIPITTTGIAKGLKNKGVLMPYRKRIKLQGCIEDMPDSINLDITDLDVGDNILVKDLPLSEKVIARLNATVPVFGLIKAK